MRSAKEHDESLHPVALAQWVDENDVPIETVALSDGPELGDVLTNVGSWVVDRIDDAGEVKAAAGPRLGPAQERSNRSGSLEEVCAPLFVRPQITRWALQQRDVFESARPVIDVDVDSLEKHDSWSSWLASVRTGPFHRREATLRIGPSPSGNLTVLQLMPVTSRRIYTRAFVRVGVPAIDEIGRALSRACDTLRHRPSSGRLTRIVVP